MNDEDECMPVRGVVVALAELPGDAYLDAKALGEILGCHKKSVQRAVQRGELPPPVRFMGKHVWLVSTIIEHFRARQDAAIKDADNTARRLSRLKP